MKNISPNKLRKMIEERADRQMVELSSETTNAFLDNRVTDIEVLERYGL